MPEQNTPKHVAEHQSHTSLVAEAMAIDYYFASGMTLPANGAHS